MPYTKLLNDIIDRSGLTLKEIAEKCSENGVKVTASYISALKNDTNNRTPSDEMSRAIAKACKCVDEGILVLEAYIDSAPPEFNAVLKFLKSMSITSVIGVFANKVTDEELKNYVTFLDNMPLSSFLIQMSKNTDEEIKKGVGILNLQSTFNDEMNDIRIQAEIKEAQGFPVMDNSMFPLIPQNSKTIIEFKLPKEMNDGDIILFTKKNGKDFYYRKVAFLNEEHTKIATFPINTEYETVTYNCDELSIVGKVKQVITNL